MIEDASSLELATLSMGLLGGLSIFLYGMEKMTDALKSVAGGGMRNVLSKLTTNRFAAATTGALVTAVIQSSSVTTVLVVGFVTAGLMTLAQSVGVIMGANIGSTITAQIVAFNVTQYALLIVTVGFGGVFLGKRDIVKRIGALLMGLGLIFLGMGLMSDATSPLRTYEPFIDLMQRMSNPFLAILVGAAFTGLVQSSSATTGIVIMLATQGFITLEAGIALAFGANVGTCITALLAALGKPRVALQAALVHVVFNVVGVLIWIPMIGILAEWVRELSPASPGLEGAARLAAEAPRQIANAHTLFNVVNTLLFLPFTTLLARLVEKIAPVVPEVEKGLQPKFLDEASLEAPAIALDRLRLEIVRLGGHVQDVFLSLSRKPGEIGHPAEEIAERVGEAESLQRAIVAYSRKLLSLDLRPRESELLEDLLSVNGDVEAVRDIIGVNLTAFLREWQGRNLKASDATHAKYLELFDAVSAALKDALRSVEEIDADLARSVVTRKADVVALSAALSRQVSSRLAADEPDRIDVYRLEAQVVEILKRVYYFAKRIAKTVDQAVAAADAETAAETEVTEFQ